MEIDVFQQLLNQQSKDNVLNRFFVLNVMINNYHSSFTDMFLQSCEAYISPQNQLPSKERLLILTAGVLMGQSNVSIQLYDIATCCSPKVQKLIFNDQ